MASLRRQLVPSLLASRLSPPVTANHTQSKPHQSAEKRRDHREQPERPLEGPEQEIERDVLGVLHDKDEQQPGSGQRGDRSGTEPAPRIARRAAVTRTLLDHQRSLGARQRHEPQPRGLPHPVTGPACRYRNPSPRCFENVGRSTGLAGERVDTGRGEALNALDVASGGHADHNHGLCGCGKVHRGRPRRCDASGGDAALLAERSLGPQFMYAHRDALIDTGDDAPDDEWRRDRRAVRGFGPVSYTHLTLPTIYSV